MTSADLYHERAHLSCRYTAPTVARVLDLLPSPRWGTTMDRHTYRSVIPRSPSGEKKYAQRSGRAAQPFCMHIRLCLLAPALAPARALVSCRPFPRRQIPFTTATAAMATAGRQGAQQYATGYKCPCDVTRGTRQYRLFTCASTRYLQRRLTLRCCWPLGGEDCRSAMT